MAPKTRYNVREKVALSALAILTDGHHGLYWNLFDQLGLDSCDDDPH